jgi:hypothetical protein
MLSPLLRRLHEVAGAWRKICGWLVGEVEGHFGSWADLPERNGWPARSSVDGSVSGRIASWLTAIDLGG